MEGHLSRRQPEKRSGIAPDFEHLQSFIHQNGGRAVFRQQDTIDLLSDVYAVPEFGNRCLCHRLAGTGVPATQSGAHGKRVWSARYLPFRVDSVIPVDDGEQVVELRPLGLPQHQESAFVERVMEQRDDVLLNRSKVNQHIAATDQVQLRERRIVDQIMSAEYTKLPQR